MEIYRAAIKFIRFVLIVELKFDFVAESFTAMKGNEGTEKKISAV